MLTSLSPLDGRYADKTQELVPYFSEAAFIAYRLYVEIEWLLHLFSWQEKSLLHLNVQLTQSEKKLLENLSKEVLINLDYARKTKEFEHKTNHDVKAIEYTLADYLHKHQISDKVISLIHFCCTSEDINNLAYALMIKEATKKVMLPEMEKLTGSLSSFAKEHHNLSMLSRTHGQKASPTTLGKEFAIFAYRLDKKISQLKNLKMTGKINGASGNYCAHHCVFPQVDWELLAQEFVTERLGLDFNPMTTQIESHDSMVELNQILSHFSSISIGLCRDIWGYISLGYLVQKKKEDEVGSSTMPHKVNPIDFENAEGNFGIAIALAEFMVHKLPISRFQRDLSDSTVQRSLGSVFGYFYIALLALERGLGKLEANQNVIIDELNESWELLGEALQTALRSCGVSDAYERIKKATRGQVLSHQDFINLVEASPELTEELRKTLYSLHPAQYTGLASQLVKKYTY